jgi:hypothetical protein
MVDIEPGLISDLLRQSMDEGRAPYLNVISDSMSPLIVSGDQVQISSTNRDALKVGDVVVMQGNNELLTHRFWGLIDLDAQVQIITKGDRPQHFDHPHDAGTLVGLVIARKRNRRLMDLTKGVGYWLNRWLTTLAKVDYHLFSASLTSVSNSDGATITHSGIFASTSRKNFNHRIIRRSIYGVAKLLTVIVQKFDRPVEES